ncbi:MAG: pyridoxamine 5'-phosphate oxidase family protein [Planctomycetes bacterium]|nr:pyridoxamine 5'-phosphate oxidase family protein [Planctomycetota bacterium]
MSKRHYRHISILAVWFLIGCASPATQPAQYAQPILAVPVPGNAESVSELEVEFKGRVAEAEVKKFIGATVAGYLTVNNGAAPLTQLCPYMYKNGRIYLKSYNPNLKQALKNDDRVIFTVDKHIDIPGSRAHAVAPTPTSWSTVHIFGNARAIDGNTADKYNIRHWNDQVKDSPADYFELTPDLVTSRRIGMSEIQARHIPMMFVNKDGLLAGDVNDVESETAEYANKFMAVPITMNPALQIAGNLKAAEAVLYRCWAGRLNTSGKDGPYSVVVNHTYLNGKIYIHTRGVNSLKIANINHNQNVNFTTEWFGNNINWTTVLVQGKARLIQQTETEYGQIMRTIMNRLSEFPDDTPLATQETTAARTGAILIEIVPQYIESQRFVIPQDWYPRMPAVTTRK